MLPMASRTNAALLMYEPFNGYTAGDINGQNPNANTFGMDTAAPYAANAAYDFSASGLLFSNLTASGGALTVTTTAGITGGGVIDLASPFSGTLYSSYLVHLTNDPSSTTDTVTLRINDTGTAAVANSRFRADAQSGSGTSDVVAASYDDSMVDGTGSLLSGVTYLLLGRFTNVNSALSAGVPGVATVFALTAAQFDFFKLDGTITDAELNAATVGSGASQVTGMATETLTTGTESFADGQAFQLATQGGGAGITVRYDEVRFGQSFNDVTPVPEPGIGSLLALSGLGLLALRHRQR
jgi:hypothetical protein